MVLFVPQFILFLASSRFEILFRAKNIGKRSKRVRAIKIASAAISIIVVPTALILSILGVNGVVNRLIANAGNIMGTLAVVVYIGLSFYFIIVSSKWIRSLEKDQKNSHRVRKVVFKNWLIALSNVVFCVGVGVELTMAFLLPSSLPYHFMSTSPPPPVLPDSVGSRSSGGSLI